MPRAKPTQKGLGNREYTPQERSGFLCKKAQESDL